MSKLLHELGLEATAIALEESLDKLNGLARRIESVRGVSQSMALEAQQVMPGFLSPTRPLGFFSTTPSKSQYRVSLEEISRGMWAAIAIGIAAAFTAVITLIFEMVGGDDTPAAAANGKTPALDKAIANNDKVVEQCVTGQEAIDIISHAKDHELEDAIKTAFKAKMQGTAMEDMTSHMHTTLAHFSRLDVDMLNQHGLYALLHSDRDLAPTANTLLKPALNDSDRILDEFDRPAPDYKSIAEAIKRLQENRVVNGNWEEGLSFAEYVQMLLNHRENNTLAIEMKTLGDFTELLRAWRQHAEKTAEFFKDLLRRNGDILEHLAHDARALAKRSEQVKSGVTAKGTEEDSRTLVLASQRFVMETCKSLRSLGSYVHLTIWCSNRHAKFVMFLNNSLHDILVEAKNLLKARDIEVPQYFEDAIKSMGKKK